VVRRGFGCHQDLLFEKKKEITEQELLFSFVFAFPFFCFLSSFPQKRKKKAEKQESEKAETAENKNPKHPFNLSFSKKENTLHAFV